MAQKEISAVMEGPGKVFVREFDIPTIGPREGLLKVEMAGICGSDVALYKGKRKPTVLPIIMGHETLGRIAEIGDEAAEKWGLSKGDRVVVEAVTMCGKCSYCITGNHRFCKNYISYGTRVSCNQPPHLWGSYGQYMYLAPGSMIHKISEEVPAKSGVLVNAVIANGIQWVRRIAQISIGDSIVVQGIGAQGLACTIAAREAGASPIIVTGLTQDEEGGRFQLAREFGANYTINVEKEDVVKQIENITDGEMADVVVDVSGSSAAVIKSLEMVRPQGTLLCAGLTGNTPTPIIIDTIVWREIRFQGAFSKDIQAVVAAIKLVESRKYPVEKMVSHVFPLTEVARALQTAAGETSEKRYIKVALAP